MKLTTFVPAVFTVVAVAAFAQQTRERDARADDSPLSGEAAAEIASDAHPDFATADTDKDGLLSISELQAALPDVKITDTNADGFVNQSEAEAAISDLAFETAGFTGGSSLVSEPEYGLLVSTLDDEESGNAAADARSGAPGAAARSGGAAGGGQAVDSGESAPDERVAPGRN